MAHVLEETFSLLDGKVPVDPSSFYNMCTFVEAAVLHDRLYLAGVLIDDSHLNFFKDKGIISHFGAFQQTPNAEANYKLEAYTLFNKAQILYWAHGGPSTYLDLESYQTRPDGYSDYYAFIEKCIKSGDQWWLNEGIVPEGMEDDIHRFTNGLREIVNVSRVLRVPVYDDAMVMPLEMAHYVKILPVLDLYRKVSDYFGVEVQAIFKSEGLKVVRIPPLLSIVLSRCRGREDIPESIVKTRDDFSPLRELTSKYDNQLYEADALGDKMAVLKEYEATWDVLVKKLNGNETRLLHNVWDVVKKGTTLGMLTEAVDKIRDHGKEIRLERRVNAFIDVWDTAKKVSGYEGLVERVFRETVDARLFDGYLDLANKVTEKFRLGSRGLRGGGIWETTIE